MATATKAAQSGTAATDAAVSQVAEAVAANVSKATAAANDLVTRTTDAFAPVVKSAEAKTSGAEDSPAKGSSVATGLPTKRSSAADDPLSAERTRWLIDAVGGTTKLATMLRVSASQPSRWASGKESPGVRTAPLLIDLEHVFARVRLTWDGESALVWMNSGNAHLDGARPVDVLALRGPGPVLEALDAGAWGSGS
jgi:hypothetical protein